MSGNTSTGELDGKREWIEHGMALLVSCLRRLSDYLFVAARAAAQHEGKAEEVYRKARE